MADSNDGLTLEGLAQILRDHMDGTAARFAEVGNRIDDLRKEISTVATVVRDLTQIVLRRTEELEEHRREIRQIYARMEQHDARMAEHDARFEAMARDIRRILDAMERRGGNGGQRQK